MTQNWLCSLAAAVSPSRVVYFVAITVKSVVIWPLLIFVSVQIVRRRVDTQQSNESCSAHTLAQLKASEAVHADF